MAQVKAPLLAAEVAPLLAAEVAPLLAAEVAVSLQHVAFANDAIEFA